MTGIEEIAGIVAIGGAVSGAAKELGGFVFGEGGSMQFEGVENLHTWEPAYGDKIKQAIMAHYGLSTPEEADPYFQVGTPEGMSEVRMVFTKHHWLGKAKTWRSTKKAVPTGGWGTGVVRIRIPLGIHYERIPLNLWDAAADEGRGEWRTFYHITNFRLEEISLGRDYSLTNKFREGGSLKFKGDVRKHGTEPIIHIHWHLALNGRGKLLMADAWPGDFSVAMGDVGALRIFEKDEYTSSYMAVV